MRLSVLVIGLLMKDIAMKSLLGKDLEHRVIATIEIIT